MDNIIDGSFAWDAVILNIAYSIGDFSGRTLALIKIFQTQKFLIIGNCLRIILIATTFLIAFLNGYFWNHPALIIINCLFVGLTGGLFGSAACNSIPGLLKTSREKELGGLALTVMINGGITFGSLISYIGF